MPWGRAVSCRRGIAPRPPPCPPPPLPWPLSSSTAAPQGPRLSRGGLARRGIQVRAGSLRPHAPSRSASARPQGSPLGRLWILDACMKISGGREREHLKDGASVRVTKAKAEKSSQTLLSKWGALGSDGIIRGETCEELLAESMHLCKKNRWEEGKLLLIRFDHRARIQTNGLVQNVRRPR